MARSKAGRRDNLLKQAAQEAEMKLLNAALTYNRWHINNTAKQLGITYVGLYQKMRKYKMLRSQVSDKGDVPCDDKKIT